MYRVKESKKKNFHVWTNKNFADYQDGTMPTVLKSEAHKPPVPMAQQGPKSLPEPKSGPKTFQWPKSFQGSKSSNQGPNKTYQAPKSYQWPKTFQGPKNYRGSKTYHGPKTYQVPKWNGGAKPSPQQAKVQQGAATHGRSQFRQGPKSSPGPQPQVTNVKGSKGAKAPEISVNELCRTLASLKVMSSETTDDNGPSPSKSANNNTSSEGNEPFFASNLEYYPHLPQVYYSQQYQSFSDLKANVCRGDLTQIKPPTDHDYSFVQEWRESSLSPEQRDAHVRNQRALKAQRIGREQRELENKENKMPQPSSSVKDRLVEEWLKTCENVGRQRLEDIQKILQEQREQEFRNRRQELLKQFNLEPCHEQLQKEQELELELELEPRRQEGQKEPELDEPRRQEEKKKPELEEPRRQEEPEKEELDAKRDLDQKQKEMEARHKADYDLFQAKLRNQRARTAQRIGREMRAYNDQRRNEFRFGRRDLLATAIPTMMTAEQLANMPAIPLPAPVAPPPSELPMPSNLAGLGKTTAISGTGTGGEPSSDMKPKVVGMASTSSASLPKKED